MQARLLGLVALLALPALLAGCLGGAADEGAPLQRGDVPVEPPAGGKPGAGWAPLEDALIRPGIDIQTPSRACPSNFLFIRPDNTSVFLGTTAHCVRDLPVGGLVTVGGPENVGVVVYSSWATMHELGETDPVMLEYNDFAVIRIDDSARRHVNPTQLHVGGPAGMAEAAQMELGARARTWSNGTLGVQPQEGVVTGKAGAWALLVHAAPPTLPGGMGRAALAPDGRALGVVVSLGVAPNPGANAVARLDTLMAYAEEHAKLYMELVSAEPGQMGLVPPLPRAPVPVHA